MPSGTGQLATQISSFPSLLLQRPQPVPVLPMISVQQAQIAGLGVRWTKALHLLAK